MKKQWPPRDKPLKEVKRYAITVIERLDSAYPVGQSERTQVYVSSEVEDPNTVIVLETHDYVIKTREGMAIHPRHTVEKITVAELEDLGS